MKTDTKQLLLDFSKSRDTLLQAAQDYAVAKHALETVAVTAVSADDERELFNQLVKHLAIAKYEGSFHEAYVDVYQRFSERTGWHPALVKARKSQSHLECICAKGLLGVALDIVRKLVAGAPLIAHA